MKYIPYGRQDVTEKDINEVTKVLRSDFLTQGPKVEEFENPNNDELVLYYAPWCGATVAFVPEWNRMKDLIKESGLNIPTREVDCEPTDANGKASLNPVCDVEKITGYPTIKKVKSDGSSSKEFVGMRKAEEITRFFQETQL